LNNLGMPSPSRSACFPFFDPRTLCHNSCVRFLRMKPGHGEVVIAEGDVELRDDELRLIEAFREQLDTGMWAAVPVTEPAGRRQARMVQTFDDIPRDADRVIFFPRAAGGAR